MTQIFSFKPVLEYQKRAVAAVNGPVGTRSSFSSDFNKCLFNGWPPEVLAGQVTCSGHQLCYGGHGSEGKEQALFAVCYNTETLIPEFTGHFLQSGGETVSPPGVLTNPDDINKDWISDTTLGKTMTPQARIVLKLAFTRVDLTIIPPARMGSESIARHEAEWAIDSEAMRARGIIVLVKSNWLVKKISRQNVLRELKLDFNPFLPPKHYKYGGRFSLLVGYYI